MKFCGVIGAFEPSSPHQTMKLLSWLDQGLWFGKAAEKMRTWGAPYWGDLGHGALLVTPRRAGNWKVSQDLGRWDNCSPRSMGPPPPVPGA